jgi:hypothetical protein
MNAWYGKGFDGASKAIETIGLLRLDSSTLDFSTAQIQIQDFRLQSSRAGIEAVCLRQGLGRQVGESILLLGCREYG